MHPTVSEPIIISCSPTQFNMLYRAQLQLAKWESESFKDLMPSLATLGGIIVRRPISSEQETVS